MSIIKKIKTTIKHEISQLISVMPIADLRSILAPRGVLIFENERESHLHTLSLLHGALRREFWEHDLESWKSEFGYRGEAIRYVSNTNSSRSWAFDLYSGVSVVLLRDLYTPGEEPPPVQLPELDDAVQAWNAQHGTELVLIDESELSELLSLKSDIESITNDATEADGEIRDLKEKLELEIRLRVEDAEEYNDMRDRAQELEDRAQALQGELDRWHSLGSDYGINYDVSDVERKLELLNERTEQLNEWESLGSGYGVRFDVSDVEEKIDILAEWEDVMELGYSPSEIQEQLEAADDWKQLGDDTGMEPCEVQQELDRLEEVDADLKEANDRLGRARSKALEIGMIWRSLEISLDI